MCVALQQTAITLPMNSSNYELEHVAAMPYDCKLRIYGIFGCASSDTSFGEEKMTGKQLQARPRYVPRGDEWLATRDISSCPCCMWNTIKNFEHASASASL